MKRYILFAFDDFYPGGGLYDRHLSFNKTDELAKYLAMEYPRDTYQILDTKTGAQWVFDSVEELSEWKAEEDTPIRVDVTGRIWLRGRTYLTRRTSEHLIEQLRFAVDAELTDEEARYIVSTFYTSKPIRLTDDGFFSRTYELELTDMDIDLGYPDFLKLIPDKDGVIYHTFPEEADLYAVV
ncbi:hypothetical protein MOB65_19250 [Bacillus inaquosorum]|uniref:hypothetical protein n=1 Tax=Bacillus inaquosorum TaxID=483913 RepID=UPI002280E0F4|nr:hypothetical protein [Bacillus inaquosorum]MCY7911001.1 hypothetical protein [Bacillus inaquosorum]